MDGYSLHSPHGIISAGASAYYTGGKASILIPFLTGFITVMETIVQVEVLRVKIFIQK